MPIFQDNSQATTNNSAKLLGNRKRNFEGEIMGTRRSITPENGKARLGPEDGRSMSRGEIIERLKMSKSQIWPTTRNDLYMETSGSAPPGTTQDLKTHKLQLQHSETDSKELDSFSAGLDIARPRSALHSGDFRQEDNHPSSLDNLSSPFATSPPGIGHGDVYSLLSRSDVEQRPRSKSGLQSFAHFQFLPPTSPLIHASLNPDLEASLDRQQSAVLAQQFSLSQHSHQNSQHMVGSLQSQKPSSNHLYQAHQPQRPISIPQAPRLRPRGISTSTDASPLHHAPMVGSYEESILRGRMSTTPSRPLDFIAQLGVLGKGKCKPSLRCPAHVTVPFPAVFYSYNSIGRTIDNSPSPYVGLIDLENTFPSYEGKAPSGGCYRIPQQGQLQIIIKNPNKTAVKLFLVPYDLSDMEPGTKTFIRQRSYSAGPIIDMPISNRTNLGTDRPEAAISHSEDPMERPTLRYLIHLNICCPARGRYFLYRSIRVVFANRVPDGKEKLRNEVQFPEPRYVPYKPTVLGDASPIAGSPGASRRSASAIATSPPLLSVGIDARRSNMPFSLGTIGLDQADGLVSENAALRQPPLSAAALQRRLCIPLQQAEVRSSRDTPGLIRDTLIDERVSKTSAPDADAITNEPVVMETFEAWLKRRRGATGQGGDI